MATASMSGWGTCTDLSRQAVTDQQSFTIHYVLRCSHCKEHGFPKQQLLQVQRRPSSAGGPSVAASEVASILNHTCPTI